MTDLLSEDELAGLKALGDVAATKDQLLSAIEAGAYQADITRFERAIWQLFDRARAVRLLLAENNNLRAHIDALKAERDGLKEEIDDLEQEKTERNIWPMWAVSVLKLLTERGVYLGDEDECDLPDDLAEYIRGVVNATEVHAARDAKLAKLLDPDSRDNLGRRLAP